MQKILKEALTNESYHNRPNSLSSSDLKPLSKSVRLWEFEKASRKESDVMRFGTLFHTAVLEPENYNPLIVPDKCKKKDEIIKTLEVFETRLGDYGLSYSTGKLTVDQLNSILTTYRLLVTQWVTQKDFDKIESMKEGLAQHDNPFLKLETANLLSLSNEGAEVESSFFLPIQALPDFKDYELELELRIRPDYFIAGNYMADLKSTLTADPKRFKYEVLKLGYHISAAFYLDCYNAYIKWVHREKIKELELKIKQAKLYLEDYIENEYDKTQEKGDELQEIIREREFNLWYFINSTTIEEFFLIACENTGSGICTVFKLDQDLIELGRKEYQKGLRNYIEYQKGFVYGGYSQEIVNLSL